MTIKYKSGPAYPKLTRARQTQGISQREMALVLGYETKNSYSLKERGERKFTVDEAIRVSK